MEIRSFTLAFWMIAALGFSDHASAQSNSAGVASEPELQTMEKCGIGNRFYSAKELVDRTLGRPPLRTPILRTFVAQAGNPATPETEPQEPELRPVNAESSTQIMVRLARPEPLSDKVRARRIRRVRSAR
jgi:hypothetical protein